MTDAVQCYKWQVSTFYILQPAPTDVSIRILIEDGGDELDNTQGWEHGDW